MPLYEYQCDACAHRFEVIQKFSDPPIDVCPKCGGAVKKLLSSPAIQFKGTGWYITDYAKSGKTESPSAAGETKTESKAEAKTDAKAETKSEPSKTASKDTP
jgi:putative FmdB family regulatory protein